MKRDKRFPCFSAHWKVIQNTFFEINLLNHFESPQDIFSVFLTSEYITVMFTREYIAPDIYIDTSDIEYSFYEIPGSKNEYCSFLPHNIKIVHIANIDEKQDNITIDENVYKYSELIKRGVDVPIASQIRLLILRHIRKKYTLEA